MTGSHLPTANLTRDTSLAGSPLNRTFIQPGLEDRSYIVAKPFRQPLLKNSAVTKNDELFLTINVMYQLFRARSPRLHSSHKEIGSC